MTLPAPPPGAFAVRFQMAAGPVAGWQLLNCKWGDTGKSFAHPHWLGWANHLVFTFDGRPTALHIDGDNGTLRVEKVEWLVTPSP